MLHIGHHWSFFEVGLAMASSSETQLDGSQVIASVPAEAAITSEINAVTTLDNLLQSAKPLCGKCGQEVNVFRAQLKSKSGGAFVCNACYARVNLINRTWGASVLECVGFFQRAS